MENLGANLKKLAIAVGVFLLLVAVLMGPQEATSIGKEIVAGTKHALTSVIVFGREMIKSFKEQ